MPPWWRHGETCCGKVAKKWLCACNYHDVPWCFFGISLKCNFFCKWSVTREKPCEIPWQVGVETGSTSAELFELLRLDHIIWVYWCR
jgi:hypothetical protein